MLIRVGRRCGIVCLLLVAACDLPRRVAPPEETAPPLPAGSIDLSDRPPPPPAPAPAQPDWPTLPDATMAVTVPESLEGLERVSLADAVGSGELTIEINDPTVAAELPIAYDGNTESLFRTLSINPLILTLDFAEPIRLSAARIYLAGSPYDWLVEARAGERHLARGVPERLWSQIDLPEVVPTKTIRIEALRLERDDFVHLNELELWVEP